MTARRRGSCCGFLILFFGMMCYSHATMAQQKTTHFTLTSTAFSDNGQIPKQYSCDGQNFSPPLAWQGIPANTQSLVLIVDDPDAPGGLWTHWVLINLPPEINQLPENIDQLPGKSFSSQNSWGRTGYGGPCPPDGEHRYVFTLYALSSLLDLPEKTDVNQVKKAMQGKVWDTAKIVARYRRQ